MIFWFEFKGYCSIEAENKEEAKQKFWNSYSDEEENVINEFLEITEITDEEEEEE